MNLSKEDFLENYKNYLIEMKKAMSKNNYIINNIYAKKLNKLIEKYKKEAYYSEVLNELMDDNDLKISASAAVDSLRNKSNIEKAVGVLKKASEAKGEGLEFISFSAEWALKLWKEGNFK